MTAQTQSSPPLSPPPSEWIPPSLSDWAAPSPFALETPRRAEFMLAQQAESHEESPAAQVAEEPGEARADDSHEAQAGGGSGDFEMPKEFPNLYTFIAAVLPKGDEAHGDAEGGHHAPWWVNPIFSFSYAALFVVVVHRMIRRRSLQGPSRAQVAVEGLFGGLMNFFGEIVGPAHARTFVPFIGTLWLFIVLNNLFGLIPLLKSPTAHFQTTIGLGICTFCYVNFQGMRVGGVKHYFWHLCGSPADVVGWAMVPLMLPLEIIGTLIKPLSLSLRLFGNIFGEDKLLASFLGLGLMITALVFNTSAPMVGVPLHLPFLFLATLTSVIQATVFAMLSAVYIAMLLPHEHHDEAEGGAH